MFKPTNIFRDADGSVRVYANWNNTGVYIDFDENNNETGGTFVVGCEISNKLADACREFINK